MGELAILSKQAEVGGQLIEWKKRYDLSPPEIFSVRAPNPLPGKEVLGSASMVVLLIILDARVSEARNTLVYSAALAGTLAGAAVGGVTAAENGVTENSALVGCFYVGCAEG